MLSLNQEDLVGLAEVLTVIANGNVTLAGDAHQSDDELGVPSPLSGDLKVGVSGVSRAGDRGPIAASLKTDVVRV